MRIRIGTRKSSLAQAQAEFVGNMLAQKLGGGTEWEKVLVETKGDKILNVTLDKIGGKGIFVKDIETALLEGRADLAVHSMKDVPYQMPEGFEIIAIPAREDVRDVFVGRDGCDFSNLRKGAIVGTSSMRRLTQIKMKRPDIEVVPVRGNIQTRLDKIKNENLDGIIIAAAGLKRLGLESVITNYFDEEDFVPAVGQGALGVEVCTNHQDAALFRTIDASQVRICVETERSFMKALNGDCHTPIGAYAFIEGNRIYMTGVFEVSGRLIKKDITGDVENHLEVGIALAEKIIRA